MPHEKTLQLELPDANAMRALAGTQNEHLKTIERRLGVRLGQRDTQLTVTGADDAVAVATRLIETLTATVAAGRPLFPDDVEQALKVLGRGGGVEMLSAPVILSQRGRSFAPRSLAQKKYVELIRANDITFGIGPAGTGKTYLAMAVAVAALLERKVRRIVLARPAVEAGEKLGFLPGDLAQKVDPYLRPLYDALHDMIDHERAAAFIEQGVIEVAPLAFMRGRTLNDCYAILDEAQNTTVEQMKMFLTRLGAQAKAIVTGDVTQVDLPPGKMSGLVHAQKVLAGVEGVAFAEFSQVDVVRHQVVQNVIRAYEKAEKAEKAERAG
jgi:phosphate starvation-inducible PhoH-like protein